MRNCRGDEAKKQIIKEYEIYPVSYVKLLEGQKRDGCCGTLTDVYYTFSAINRKNGKDDSFFVGKKCAEDFLDLLHFDKLPLIDPLTNDNNQKRNIGVRTNNEKKDITHPINKELITAIGLLSIAWNSPLLSMGKISVFSNNNKRINILGIKWFNEKLGNDFHHRTLTQMCDELRRTYHNFRVYNFDNLKKIRIEQGVKEENIYL